MNFFKHYEVENNKIYFKGLDSLRFFSAGAVVITHIELIKYAFNLNHSWNNTLINSLGSIGVYFFFVLSGFLITYLLLIEEQCKGKVNIKKFYLRRILRIWPIYILMLIVGFFILPLIPLINIPNQAVNLNKNFWSNFVMYLLMSPNLATSIYGSIPHIGHFWSIGVEEQFYLFWPFLLKFNNKLKSVILFIIIVLIIKSLFLFSFMHTVFNTKVYETIKFLLATIKFESMAVGALGAIVIFNPKLLIFKNLIFTKAAQLLAYLSIPLLIFYLPQPLENVKHLFFSFSFIVIIINIAVNNNSIVKLNSKVFNNLGQLSYGIYVYHFFIAAFVVALSKQYLYTILSSFSFNVVVYFFTFTISILVSKFSYVYFESYFLNLKAKLL